MKKVLFYLDENKFKYKDKEYSVDNLKFLYLEENKNIKDICFLLDIDYTILCNILKHYNIVKDKDSIKNKKSKAISSNWKNKSKEELDNIRKKKSIFFQNMWDNRTEEQKQEISNKKSFTFQSKGNEYKKELSERFSKASKERWSKMSKEEQLLLVHKMNVKNSEYLKNRSEEEKERVYNIKVPKFKDSWYARSEEEKEETKIKKSNAMIYVWKNKSEEEIDKFREIVSNNKKEEWASKSSKEKSIINQKRSNTWHNKSEEEIKSFVDKNYSTRKLHNTFNTSQPEENFYQSLLQIFPKEDIFRQYKDPRYPFNCDFYIKSRDLFIELNLHFSHGEHPFNRENKNDLNLLEEWENKSKTSQFYSTCIHTWTISDPLKQKIAKENNLNYCICYNEQDMNNLLDLLANI